MRPVPLSRRPTSSRAFASARPNGSRPGSGIRASRPVKEAKPATAYYGAARRDGYVIVVRSSPASRSMAQRCQRIRTSGRPQCLDGPTSTHPMPQHQHSAHTRRSVEQTLPEATDPGVPARQVELGDPAQPPSRRQSMPWIVEQGGNLTLAPVWQPMQPMATEREHRGASRPARGERGNLKPSSLTNGERE
jgi:hypothetical protein